VNSQIMPKPFARRALVALASLLLPALAASALLATAADWKAKVDPWVLDRVAAGGTAEFLVFLDQQADVSGAAAIHGKEARGRYVFDRLTETARRTQQPVLAAIRDLGLEHRAYWVANMIWVRGGAAAVAALAARDDVRHVDANPSVALDVIEESTRGTCPAGGPEDSLVQVGAPGFWTQGFTGQGAVVAGADTGYDWDHPGLINQYRGWNGSTASHDFNWHDAIHSTGSSCGADSPFPCDDNSHGTHTMGTMVGDNGAGAQVGMAPGARWIGCRNMNSGNGTPATYSECFQFFIAPTDLNGHNPTPGLAPDVVNGSWSCPTSEGCTDPNVLKTVVENVRAAGIVVSQAAGNEGNNGCSTVNTPAAIYAATFTVGAVNGSDTIAGFSSRGPVTFDGSNRRKPNVTAPGVGICSTIPGGGYSDSFSGTSMAAPHVSGLVALLISANPSLAGDPDAIEAYIESTTLQRTTTQGCGGDSSTDVPNNTYGWGAIRAVQLAIFTDGFESGDTSAWSTTIP
jgi:serine protease AprX